MNATFGFATMRDGARLAYRLQRTGTARPRIVLIHSLAMNGAFWYPVADLLADVADVLTYDCRGHAASDKPRGAFAVAQFADDLADLLDAVGWETCVVAGASMGGSVALAFATAYPQRTVALGLIDTTSWYGPDAPKNWAERANKAKSEGLAALVGFQQTRWFSDVFRAAHPDIVERCVTTFVANDVESFASTCAMLGAFDLRAGLATLRMPTAIVVGEEDYATPIVMSEVLHEGIAGSSLDVIGGARHLTPIERSDVIAGRLRSLLAIEEAT